jgi:hypothetical protein
METRMLNKKKPNTPRSDIVSEPPNIVDQLQGKVALPLLFVLQRE